MGFALKAKDKESHQALLGSAEALTTPKTKLEEISELLVSRFSTVTLASNTVMGRVMVTEGLIRDEIISVRSQG